MKNLKIYLAGQYYPNSFLQCLKSSWEISKHQGHVIIDKPEEADIILFTDVDSNSKELYKQLRENTLIHQFPEKCFIYQESDIVVPFLPGVYTSARKSWVNLGRLRNYCYLSRHTYSQNSYITPQTKNKELLFSFLGSSTSFVRKRLFKINFNRSDVLVEDTTIQYQHYNYSQGNRQAMQQKFVDVALKSKFVLCPRGSGRGSIRLFEMMEMKLVPVIISDNYLLPQGPKWQDFTIFVKEKDINKLPEILERRASEVEKMGELAYQAWKEWFSPNQHFNYIVNACYDIKRKRIIPEKIYYLFWGVLLNRELFISQMRNNTRKYILFTFKLLKIKFPYSVTRE